MSTRSQITISQLDTCLDFIARLVMRDRAKYECLLPIYERIENEIEVMRSRNKQLESINARINRINTDQNKDGHITAAL